MWLLVIEFLKNIEAFFKEYPFLQDFVIAVAGVVFGGIITVFINKGARRKQALFEMQLEILKKELASAEELAKKIENIEIILSFKNATIEEIASEIEETQVAILKLMKSLKDKRIFVSKYLKAITVEEFARLGSDYMMIFYSPGDKGFSNIKQNEKLDQRDIDSLREIVKNTKKVCRELTEAMECVISPGIFSGLKRKLRSLKMFIDEIIAVAKVDSRKKR